MAHRREPRWELVARVASDSLNDSPGHGGPQAPPAPAGLAVRLRGGALTAPSALSEGDSMTRTVTAIRRTIAAALGFGQYTARRAVSRAFCLLIDLFRAIDANAAMEIAYVKRDGTESTRVIEPADLDPTLSGHITVRGHDRLRGEDRTFRIDRIVGHRLVEVG